jgi:pimeloyl-ACP methyl ester carboxylesterase
VDLAEMLAAHFDVYTFDFRGHGESGGRLRLGLAGPLQDMEAVVEHVHGRGYAWLGAVGFSLGGMVSIVHAALHPGLDAVAAVGAPPALPDISPYRRLLPAWSLFLRTLGARFTPVSEGGPLPLDVAEGFPPLPLLVVHGEREVFYSRSDLEAMLNRLGDKVEFWEIAGAGHAELAGREPQLVGWFMEKSGNRARHVPGRRA